MGLSSSKNKTDETSAPPSPSTPSPPTPSQSSSSVPPAARRPKTAEEVMEEKNEKIEKVKKDIQKVEENVLEALWKVKTAQDPQQELQFYKQQKSLIFWKETLTNAQIRLDGVELPSLEECSEEQRSSLRAVRRSTVCFAESLIDLILCLESLDLDHHRVLSALSSYSPSSSPP
eukprot:CAMPEP_0184343694 /NCGR_PEP_ID=MMETSP1089-20130417/12187_1 /TAXON_ID=38269 ORGANISM="Gloeochaete wittrockiana, Strain SAG46.84" /NCGR_SAMPLE_ID=MMETSP1089 /ASSEMBLY_ACC=CAM_ASM_000445 /LENGTH=173 /DNA_ID=CAMNT_0026673093 /DNA_START=152 /DNA_END=673 /DNA_ORIENTATION=-